MTRLDHLPIDEILITRKSLRRQLLLRDDLQPVRIAVLGGATTQELVDLLELLLLERGFLPEFYQSDYGRYFEEAVHDSARLIEFKPDLVYLHTSCRDVEGFPRVVADEAELATCVEAELARYRQVWAALAEKLGCQIIQNNFEAYAGPGMGNFDAVSSGGRSRFLTELNGRFARETAAHPSLILQDVHGISARLGLERWFDWPRWFSYKMLVTPEASLAIAKSLAAIVGATYGKSRKVLVLDLDNTLWGGVIGDDGVDGIVIGRETPVGEAYTAFQEYCLALRDRGVLLAVCSKNDDEVARQGFSHPDSVLKLEHISCFKANWEPKHENVLAIARELNLGVDSFVFLDDNPAERALVEAQIDGIAVPEIGDDVADYPRVLEAGRYFEAIALSAEDTQRAQLYAGNERRTAAQGQFADYAGYLDSLQMVAEIGRFIPVYLERIAQLTNKTNQFNLTTRRYTLAEMEAIAGDPGSIALYGRLLDRFGDNGLVSVVLGRKEDAELHLDLWLMSCRVLKRDMELAMLDALVEHARAAEVETIFGYFVPTKKNAMVAKLFDELGFERVTTGVDGSTVWRISVEDYAARNRHISVGGERSVANP